MKEINENVSRLQVLLVTNVADLTASTCKRVVLQTQTIQGMLSNENACQLPCTPSRPAHFINRAMSSDEMRQQRSPCVHSHPEQDAVALQNILQSFFDSLLPQLQNAILEHVGKRLDVDSTDQQEIQAEHDRLADSALVAGACPPPEASMAHDAAGTSRDCTNHLSAHIRSLLRRQDSAQHAALTAPKVDFVPVFVKSAAQKLHAACMCQLMVARLRRRHKNRTGEVHNS